MLLLEGIYTSTDESSTWTAMNARLNNMEIECLTLDPINKILHAGTSGAGLFRCDISSSIDPISKPKLPVQFALKHDFPNLLNPKTISRYEVPLDKTSLIGL